MAKTEKYINSASPSGLKVHISDIEIEMDLRAFAMYTEQKVSDAAKLLIFQKLSELKERMNAAEYAKFLECKSAVMMKLVETMKNDEEE